MSNRHLRRLNKDEFLLDSGSGSGSEDDTRNVSSQSKFAFVPLKLCCYNELVSTVVGKFRS